MAAVETAAPRGGDPRPRIRLSSPPGRLRLMSLLVTAVLIALWIAAIITALRRDRATDALADGRGAEAAAAQVLRADLATAEAAAARMLLPDPPSTAATSQDTGDAEGQGTGVDAGRQGSGSAQQGAGPGDPGAAYRRAVADAGDRIVELAGVADTRTPLRVISRQLPVYTGQVERARANARFGYAVGASYLREASALMRGTILPAADQLATADAERVDHDYRRASGVGGPLLVAGTGAGALALLVAVQVRLFRRTNRLLNPALVAATLLTALAAGWALTAFGAQRAHLRDARDDGFAPMVASGQARALAQRAWADETLALLSPGDTDAVDADADAATIRLGYDPRGDLITATGATPPGLLAGLATPSGDREPLGPLWQVHQTNAAQVRALRTDPGGMARALTLYRGPDTAAFGRFDGAATAVFDTARTRFTRRLDDTAGTLDSLPAALCVALGLAAALTLVGLQMRINDYR